MTELPKTSPLEASLRQLLRWRLVILPVVAILFVVSLPIAAQLEFDQAIESLYADDDEYFSAYARSKALFGGDEFAFVAWREQGLFESGSNRVSDDSRKRIETLGQKLAAVPGVYPESLQTLPGATDVQARIGDALRELGLPVVFNRLIDRLDFSAEQKQAVAAMEGVLVGEDRETTAIVVRLKPATTAVPRGETVARIRELAAAHDPPAFVVGEPVQVHDMFRYVEEDGRILFHVSLLLLAAVLFLMFRTLRWVLLPLIVVLVTIRWTEAILVLSGAKLSMVSSMLNSLVTIIGIATATHIAIRFREKRQTEPRESALANTISELTPAIFWTCATTAVGFAALLSSHITPVRSFGLMMSLATLIVFFVVVLLTPGGMSRWIQPVNNEQAGKRAGGWLDIFIGDPVPAPAERHLVRVLGGVGRLVHNRPTAVGFAAAAIVAVAGIGLTRLRVETDFSRNFREDSELVQSLNFFETRLGGAGTWDVNFPAPDQLTEDFIAQVRAIAAALREELGATDSARSGRLTKVVALTDGLDLVPNKVGVGFLSKQFTLKQRLSMLKAIQPDFLTGLYNADRGRMRIVLRGLERQPSASKLALIARVRDIVRQEVGTLNSEIGSGDNSPAPTSDFQVANSRAPETTGLFVLLTFLIESLLRDQVVSFVIAAVGIGTMLSLAFRSVRLGLSALVPNLFPIVLVIGFMGWVGLPINIATAMIASVSMGLTVDSSVHYMAQYQRLRRQGESVAGALEKTQTSVGRALVFANVALVAGFSVLTLSQFIPLVYFGLLVSVAMLGGLAGNLFLLPLLLTFADRETRPSTSEPTLATASSTTGADPS
ncbi:MAG: efflux RND transporter permease subunit [Planctomycetota bacterium]|jgi:predicted RND superfamily exporter protein